MRTQWHNETSMFMFIIRNERMRARILFKRIVNRFRWKRHRCERKKSCHIWFPLPLSLSLHSFFIYKWPRIVQFNPLETAWIHVMICLCQFLISIFVWHTIRYGKCTQYLVYVRIVCRCRQSHERRRKSEWAKWRAGKKIVEIIVISFEIHLAKEK